MRVLRRASDILGGEHALARELRVPMGELRMWLQGSQRPTRPMFLGAVDILIEHGDAGSLGADASMPPSANEQHPGSFLRIDEEKKA
jgi:hypothetical protein